MSNELTRIQKQRLRKLKKKVYKINYLNEELNDVRESIDEYRTEFINTLTEWLLSYDAKDAIAELFPKKSQEEMLSDIENIDEKETIDIEVKHVDPWAKEIFRQIASETHEDKLSQMNDLSEEEKEKRVKTFIKARKLLDDNDGPSLYIIAVELGIKMKNIPDDILEHFDNSIKNIQTKIEKNQNTHAWYWSESSLEDKIAFINNINEKYEIKCDKAKIVSFLSAHISES